MLKKDCKIRIKHLTFYTYGSIIKTVKEAINLNEYGKGKEKRCRTI